MGHRTSDLEMIITAGDQREVRDVGAMLGAGRAAPEMGLYGTTRATLGAADWLVSRAMGRTSTPPHSRFSLGGGCQGVGAAVTDPWPMKGAGSLRPANAKSYTKCLGPSRTDIDIGRTRPPSDSLSPAVIANATSPSGGADGGKDPCCLPNVRGKGGCKETCKATASVA